MKWYENEQVSGVARKGLLAGLAVAVVALVVGVISTPPKEEPETFRWTDKNRWE